MITLKNLLVLYFLCAAGLFYYLDYSVTDKLMMNYAIMLLYCAAVVWWFSQGHPWDAAYWLAAGAITFVVTFGYAR